MGLLSRCGARASPCSDFCCSFRAWASATVAHALSCLKTYGILVPGPGVKPMTPAFGRWIRNHSRRHHLYKESASEAQESWARERHLKGLSPFITCCTLNSRLLGRSRNFPSPLSKKSLRKGQFKSLNLTPFSPTGQASRLLSIATECQGLRVKGPHWLSWDGAKQTAGTLTAQA